MTAADVWGRDARRLRAVDRGPRARGARARRALASALPGGWVAPWATKGGRACRWYGFGRHSVRRLARRWRPHPRARTMCGVWRLPHAGHGRSTAAVRHEPHRAIGGPGGQQPPPAPACDAAGSPPHVWSRSTGGNRAEHGRPGLGPTINTTMDTRARPDRPRGARRPAAGDWRGVPVVSNGAQRRWWVRTAPFMIVFCSPFAPMVWSNKGIARYP